MKGSSSQMTLCRTYTKPIGMFDIVPILLSLSEVEVGLSRSFDAGQCVSSEGFWATFTPRGRSRRVNFLYAFLPGFIQIQPPSGPAADGKRQRESFLSPKPPRPGTLAGSFIRGNLGRKLRVKLMTLANPTLEVLVATEPTEDDRIGTGRNLHESYTTTTTER